MGTDAAYMREWRKKNREKARAIQRKAQDKYRKENPEKVLEIQRKHYRQNPQLWKRWKARNPDKVKTYKARYRFLKKNNLGNFHSWMVRYYRYVQQNRCFYCNCDISKGYHLEHMVPLTKGGKHCWTNTCLSCESCNHRKGTKTHGEFMQNE